MRFSIRTTFAALAIAAATFAADVPAPAADTIQSLIQQLGDADPRVRDRAESELGSIGAPARKALVAALDSTDLEIKVRAGNTLEHIRVKMVRTEVAWNKPLAVASLPAGTLMLPVRLGKQEMLLVSAAGKISAFDLSNPKDLRDLPTPLWSIVNPAGVAGGNWLAQAGALFLATNAQYELHAYDLASGKEQWVFKDPSPPASATARDPLVVPGFSQIFVSGPVNGDGRAVGYVAGPTKLFALDLTNGTALWTNEGLTGLIGGPVANDTQVFVAAPAVGVRIFDRTTGQEKPTILTSPTLYSKPFVDNNSLYILAGEGTIAYDLKVNAQRWTHQESRPTLPAVAGATTAAAPQFAAAPAAGRLSTGLIPPILHSGRLYVANLDTLFSLNPDLSQKNVQVFWQWQPTGLPRAAASTTQPTIPAVFIPRTVQQMTLPEFTKDAAILTTVHGLFALDLNGGLPAWEFHPADANIVPTQLSPAVLSGGLVHAMFSLNLYKLTSNRGAPANEAQFYTRLSASRNQFAVPLEK